MILVRSIHGFYKSKEFLPHDNCYHPQKGWQHGMRRKGLIGWCLGVWGCPMAITHISHIPSPPFANLYTRCHEKNILSSLQNFLLPSRYTSYNNILAGLPTNPLSPPGAYHCISHHNYHHNGYCLHQFCVSVVDNFVLSFWCIPTSKEQKARHHSENYCFSPKLYSIFVRDPQSLQSKFTKVYLMR